MSHHLAHKVWYSTGSRSWRRGGLKAPGAHCRSSCCSCDAPPQSTPPDPPLALTPHAARSAPPRRNTPICAEAGAALGDQTCYRSGPLERRRPRARRSGAGSQAHVHRGRSPHSAPEEARRISTRSCRGHGARLTSLHIHTAPPEALERRAQEARGPQPLGARAARYAMAAWRRAEGGLALSWVGGARGVLSCWPLFWGTVVCANGRHEPSQLTGESKPLLKFSALVSHK